MIDRAIIDSVRSIRLDEIVGESVGLKKKSDDDWIGLCPFHNEKTPSLHVHPERGFFKCFGCGAGGDVIDFVRRHNGVNFERAVELLSARTGNVLTKTAPVSRRIVTRQPSRTWLSIQQSLRPLSFSEISHLASLRKIPCTAGLELASRLGHLFFTEVFDDGFHHDCWLITDSSRRNAQARRLDGKPFDGIKAKAKTISGCEASWPIGAPDLSCPEVALVEGGPDFLSAWHLIWFLERTAWIRPVAILGANNPIHPEALPAFAGKTVHVFPHRDEAGEMACSRWSEQLLSVGAYPIPFDLSIRGVKDLNDLVSTATLDDQE